MKALCWYGTNDVRVDTVPDPTMAIFAQPLEKVHSSHQLARAWGTGRWSTA
jgi:hypothetical protein